MAPTVLTADLGPGVLAGFTTREGGASTGEHAGLDLALHVGDDPEAVRRNRSELAAWVGAPVQFVRQVHGREVAVVAGGVPADPEPEADAVVSADPRVGVAVLVADCVPVLLADPAAGVVAAVHAGRVGLVSGVLQAAVDRMAEAGADPASTVAVLGPSAGPCCYEVGDRLRDEVAAAVPRTWSTTTWGTASVDLRAGCAAVLAGAGVARVGTVGGCTIEDVRLYSHRRAGAEGASTTGRFVGVVRLLDQGRSAS